MKNLTRKLIIITLFCLAPGSIMLVKADELHVIPSPPTLDGDPGKVIEKTMKEEKQLEEVRNKEIAPEIQAKPAQETSAMTSDLSPHKDREVTESQATDNNNDSAKSNYWSRQRMRRSHDERNVRVERVDRIERSQPIHEINVIRPNESRHRILPIQPDTSASIPSDSSSFANEMHRIAQRNRNLVDERQFREREPRVIDLQRQERNLPSRVINLNETRFRMDECDLRARQQYYIQLRNREWLDTISRDRELNYLLSRERELSRYYWQEDDLICHYVTRFKKVARVNKHVTVCGWRNGRYRCYHPIRYYIYPITRVVCE